MDQPESLSEQYDFLVVGGGIVGSGLFRDLCLHGKKTLLIDRGDFNAQTSQSSSKMLHGGIRYLENFDFLLVWEALHEKNHWVKTTPHLAIEKEFFLPVYKETKYPLWMVQLGLWVYALLSGFKQRPRKVVGVKKLQEVFPGIKTDTLKGAGIYSDSVVDDHKLGLECLYDGLHHHAESDILNFCEIINIQDKNDDKLVTLSNQGVETQIKVKTVLFATGPFTDQVLAKLELPWQKRMLLNKGSHIWIKKESLNIQAPLVLQTKDKRVIFVIPDDKKILVGTTEKVLDEKTDIFNIQASEDEIDYLIQCLHTYFPGQEISKGGIIASFSGVRPLVRSGSSATKTSRTHKVFKVSTNTWAIIGGKYTTFRVMAQHLLKKVAKDQGWKYDPHLSLQPLQKQSIVTNIETTPVTKERLDQIKQEEFIKDRDDLIKRRLSLPSLQLVDPKTRELIEEWVKENL